jgi:hypothetical protein
MTFQRKVLRKADAVLFASESTRRDYLARNLVGESKAVHVPLFLMVPPIRGDEKSNFYASNYKTCWCLDVRTEENCYFLR